MRKRNETISSDYKVMVLDDEQGIVDSLLVMIKKHGYDCVAMTNPELAVKELIDGEYDILISDYIMQPIHGDKVVEAVREYKKDLEIILLTGHKDLAPPLEIMKMLDINLYCEKSDNFDQILISLASAAKSVDQKRKLKEAYQTLENSYMGVMESLRRAVDARDFYTRGHSDRVAYYAVKIGEKLDVSTKELELLKVGGIFHDIGKIGVSDDVLLKNCKLSDEEFNQIKQHPVKGEKILYPIHTLREIIPLVKHHHEKFNGTGYPSGLKGEEIPFLARIVTVCDAFDAMTSDRVYRSKLKLEDVKSELVRCSGIQFDEQIVKVFLNILEDYDKMQKELQYTFELTDNDKDNIFNLI